MFCYLKQGENLNHHVLLYLENHVLVCSFHPTLSSLYLPVPNARERGSGKPQELFKASELAVGWWISWHVRVKGRKKFSCPRFFLLD